MNQKHIVDIATKIEPDLNTTPNMTALSLSQTPAWKNLLSHFDVIKSVHMRDLFADDAKRFDRFSLFFNDILYDYSKNRIDATTMKLLLDLAKQENLSVKIEQMFSGATINFTENRAVLHTALRSPGNQSVFVDGEDVMPKIHRVRKQMRQFVDRVLFGDHRGFTGKKITDVVNIGIGGSDLGGHMVTEALKSYACSGINVHFVSNIDGVHVGQVMSRVNPETTLFVIASKSFTTPETLTNATTAREWLLAHSNDETSVAKHFVAISTNTKAVIDFGIDPGNMFEFWDWVGGRFSLWSAIGLPIALFLGNERFNELLDGAYQMDCHFRETPFEKNLPVIHGLLGIWYSSFFNCKNYAVLPYDQNLHRFTAFLQQTEMESNGKSYDRNGIKVDYHTSPVLWGESGTNGQHAFYQMMHQGTQVIPADFMMPIHSQRPLGSHHQQLFANCIAQSETLMLGRTEQEAIEELNEKNVPQSEIAMLAKQMVMPGNKPTNTILFNQLDPSTLGSLIAFYEHKIFVQGAIWRINSFDQFGVELGKKLAEQIIPEILGNGTVQHDSSTSSLVKYFKNNHENV